MALYKLIYSNEEIIVVSKSPGVPCHPLEHSTGTTLIEAVSHEYPELLTAFGEDREGGLCHRIDNGTSGLVVIARNKGSKEKYRQLFLQGKIEKTYLALAQGQVQEGTTIDFAIAHHQKNKRKMAALTSPQIRFRSHPQEAHTLLKVLLANNQASLVRVQIGAGRRHQIRVHLAAIGHPLFGDALYGGPLAEHIQGHALHAATLTLPDGQVLEAACPAEWEQELMRFGLLAS